MSAEEINYGSDRHTNKPPPLPAEILELSEGDTACQYCGVSYLLLSRMTALKSQFSALEKQLKTCKEYELEYPQLKQESVQLQHASLELKKRVEDQLIDIQSQKTQMADMNTRTRVLESTLNDRDETITRLQRHEHITQSRVLESIDLVRRMKNDVNVLRKDKSLQSLRAHVKESIYALIATAQTDSDTRVATEVGLIEEKLMKQHHEQQSALNSEIDRLRRDAVSMKEDGDSLRKSRDHLRTECTNLQLEIETLQCDSARSRISTEQEIQSLRNQLNKQTSREQEHVTEKKLVEDEFKVAKERNAQLESQLSCEQNEHSITKKALLIASQSPSRSPRTEEIVEDLRKKNFDLQSQVRTASKERAEITTAHQNQLVQLQKSFQDKLDAQQREKESGHEYELALKEDQVRRAKETCRELEIQLVDLRNGLIQSESRALQFQVKAAQEQVCALEHENRALQIQLKAAREQVCALEHDKVTLQNQLKTAREQVCASEHDKLTLESRIQVLEQGTTWWEKERQAMAREIATLKLTVRHECEERLALKDLLDRTKVPPALATSIPRSPSRTADSSPRFSTSTESMFEQSLASAKKAKRIRMRGRGS